MSIVKTLGNAVLHFMERRETNDPIVRLFEVEYNKEYRSLKANGIKVNRKIALDHMNNR
jgi:hypothetical protein